MTNSRAKGARGERLIRDELRALGYKSVSRTAQRSGRTGVADLEGIDGAHLECKVGARIDIWKAMAQAKRDSGGKGVPVVLAHKDRTETLVVFPLSQVVEFMAAFLCDTGAGAKED